MSGRPTGTPQFINLQKRIPIACVALSVGLITIGILKDKYGTKIPPKPNPQAAEIQNLVKEQYSARKQQQNLVKPEDDPALMGRYQPLQLHSFEPLPDEQEPQPERPDQSGNGGFGYQTGR